MTVSTGETVIGGLSQRKSNSHFILYWIPLGLSNKIEVKPIFGLDNMDNLSTAEGSWEDTEGQRFPAM